MRSPIYPLLFTMILAESQKDFSKMFLQELEREKTEFPQNSKKDTKNKRKKLKITDGKANGLVENISKEQENDVVAGLNSSVSQKELQKDDASLKGETHQRKKERQKKFKSKPKKEKKDPENRFTEQENRARNRKGNAEEKLNEERIPQEAKEKSDVDQSYGPTTKESSAEMSQKPERSLDWSMSFSLTDLGTDFSDFLENITVSSSSDTDVQLFENKNGGRHEKDSTLRTEKIETQRAKKQKKKVDAKAQLTDEEAMEKVKSKERKIDRYKNKEKAIADRRKKMSKNSQKNASSSGSLDLDLSFSELSLLTKVQNPPKAPFPSATPLALKYSKSQIEEICSAEANDLYAHHKCILKYLKSKDKSMFFNLYKKLLWSTRGTLTFTKVWKGFKKITNEDQIKKCINAMIKTSSLRKYLAHAFILDKLYGKNDFGERICMIHDLSDKVVANEFDRLWDEVVGNYRLY